MNYNTYQEKFSKLKQDKSYILAISLSEDILNSDISERQKTEVYYQLAKLYVDINDRKNTYAYLTKIENNIKDSTRINYYENIGNLYVKIKEYPKALKIYNDLLKYLDKNNKTKSEYISVYRNIGDLHNVTENDSLALKNYNKSLQLAKNLKDFKAMSLAYNNITTIEISNKDYKSALNKLLKSKTLLSKIGSSELAKNSIDYNIASVYIALDELEKAKKLLEIVKAYCLANNQENLYAYCLVTETEIFEKEGNTKSIASNLNKALEIVRLQDNKTLQAEITLRLSTLLEKEGKLNEALEYYKNYKTLNDSIAKEIKTKDLNDIQSKLEVSQYKKDLKIQNQKIEILKIKSTKFNYILVLFILLSISLALYAVKQFKTLKIKKKNTLYAKEINKLKEEKLKNEVEFKNSQITEFAIQIQNQNQQLLKLKNVLKKIKKNQTKEGIFKDIKNTTMAINSHIKLNNEKVQLNASIKESSDQFLLKLKTKFPDLKEKEIKICTLIRLNYDTKQIAEQMGIAEHSIHNYRYSIRKKFGLDKSVKLDEFLKNL